MSPLVSQLGRFLRCFPARTCWWLGWLLAVGAGAQTARAQERTFTLDGGRVVLTDVSDRATVLVRSLRYLPERRVWNASLLVRNAGSIPLRGPIVVVADSWTGTSGPRQTDTSTGSGEPEFWRLSSGPLGTNELTVARLIVLGAEGTVAPQVRWKVYAGQAPVESPGLGFTRTLTAAGLPLGEVTVTQLQPSVGPGRVTEAEGGVVSVNGLPGSYRLRFDRPGFLSSFAEAELSAGGLTLIPNPRLTPRDLTSVELAPGAVLASADGLVELTVDSGAPIPNGQRATLTVFPEQALPAPLPVGWSPLAAWSWEPERATAARARVRLGVRGVAAGTVVPVTLASDGRWVLRGEALTVDSAGVVVLTLNESERVAVVVPDAGGSLPAAGAELPAGSTPVPTPDQLQVTSRVEPPVVAASTNATLVTARAELTVSNRLGVLTSGGVLRLEISEQYELSDGSRRTPPRYETFVRVFRRPDAINAAVGFATFPLRPLLLFPGDQLQSATVTVEVLAPADFAGGRLVPGGSYTNGGFRVVSQLGDLVEPQAILLEPLGLAGEAVPGQRVLTDLELTGGIPRAAFELHLGGVTPGRRLGLQVDRELPDGEYVLLQLRSRGTELELQPRERLSRRNGEFQSAERPGSPAPGLAGSGQFVVVQVPGPVEWVTGQVEDAGASRTNLPVTVTGQPWVVFTDATGRFLTLAPAGSVEVAVRDSGSARSAFRTLTVVAGVAPAPVTLALALEAPRVLTVSPVDGAVGVDRLVAPKLTLSRPLRASSVNSGTVVLRGTNAAVIPARIALESGNTVLRVYPAEPLAGETQFTLELAASIADDAGTGLTGRRQFSFVTVSTPWIRPPGAQLYSWAPTNGVARIVGTEGLAPPGSPVIFVNDTTGETATSTAGRGGEFAQTIPAGLEDRLRLVFVNADGTRSELAVGQQRFPDGSVAFYSEGGILTVTNLASELRELRLEVPPGAVSGRTRFRLEPRPLLDADVLTSNTPPADAQALGFFRLEIEGDPLREPVRLIFKDLDLDRLQPPAGRTVDDIPLVVGAPTWVDEAIGGTPTRTLGYRYLGQVVPLTNAVVASGRVGRQSILAGGVLTFAGSGNLSAMLFGPIIWSKMEVAGKVFSADLSQGPVPVAGSEVPLAGAVVRGRSRSNLSSIPFSLQPGEIYTISDANGFFAFLAPANYQSGAITPLLQGYSLNATHPAFPGQMAGSHGRASVYDPSHPFGGGTILFDRTRPADTQPPSIFASHVPGLPAVSERIRFTATASDPGGIASLVALTDSVNPFNAVVNLRSAGSGIWELTSDRPAKVVLRVEAVDGYGNRATRTHAILIGQPPSAPPTLNDPAGPLVVGAEPDAGALGVSPATVIQLQFSEELDDGIRTNAALFLTLSPSAGTLTSEFGRSRRDVVVRVPGLRPDTDYTLTVQGVRDLSGQVLDQNPATNSPAAEPFVLNFRTAPELSEVLPGITEGGGALIRGAYAFVLDRQRQSPQLVVFDISVPSRPVRVYSRPLPGPPRAMVLIPDYDFATSFVDLHQPDPNQPVGIRRGNLLAVAGQLSGATTSYLRVLDLGGLPDDVPTLAGNVLSIDPTSLITRLDWSPPYLLAVENSSEAPSLHVLNLQAVILGQALTDFSRQFARAYLPAPPVIYPERAVPAVDANQDGDFVDPGDSLPVPGLDTVGSVAGEVSLLTLMPNRRGANGGELVLVRSPRFVTDAFIDGPAGYLGALTTPGADTVVEFTSAPVSTNRVDHSTEFRSFLVGQNLSETASVSFPEFYPKRAVPVMVFGRRLVLVNLLSLDNQTNRICVLDTTRAESPVKLADLDLPQSEFGVLQGAMLDERGRIVLSTVTPTGENFVLLDPTRFLDPVVPGAIHPAVLGVIPGAGGGVTSFGVIPGGTSVASLRGVNVVAQTAPVIRLVQATTNSLSAFDEPDLTNRLAELRSLADVEFLPVARHGTNISDLLPANPARHFHLWVEAPGGAGRELEVTALSLDAAGFVVVRTNGAAPPAVLRAVPLRRLTSDPRSPAFNTFLSRPLALLAEDLPLTEANAVQAALRRHVLFAGTRLRVGFSEELFSNPALSDFAGAGRITVAVPTNTLPPRLGVALGRPVLDLQPRLEADDTLVIRTVVDAVNTNACPGSAYLSFGHTVNCRISLFVDGQPARNLYDDQGRFYAIFTNVPSAAGAHQILLDAAAVGDPGRHTFGLVGTQFDGSEPQVTLSEPGVVEHEVEIHHNFPVGHTIIQGVDLWDGHLTHSRQDVAVPGRKLALDFSRTYSNGGNSSAGPLGGGWTHNYHIRLEQRCGVWTVIGGEGTGNAFTHPQPEAVKLGRYARFLPAAVGQYEFFQPQVGYHSVLVRDTDRTSEAWFFTKSAVRYHFVSDGSSSTPSATVYRLRSIREPNGNELRLNYQDNDSDPATLDTVTEYEPTGVPKRGFRFQYRVIAGEDRLVNLRGFNQQGSPDLLGLEIRYAYDEWGNLTNVTRWGGSPAESRTDSYTYTPGFEGPTTHNLLTWTDPNGAVTQYEYFPAGAAGYYAMSSLLEGAPPHETVRSITRLGTARPGFAATDDSVTRFTYDFAGGTRRVSDPRTGLNIPDTVYTLNAYGATVRIEAPLGQTTLLEWATDHRNGAVRNEAGQAVNDVVLTRKVDAEGQEVRYEYHDGRGNVTREITTVAPGKRAVFDSQGGTVTASELVQTYHPVFNFPETVVDAEGHSSRFELDPATGNLLRSTDGVGSVTVFEYYPNGDVQIRRDPRGFETRFVRYDPYGNAEWIVDAEGNEISNQYDERSRLRETRDTFTHHRTFAYDALDRLVAETQENDLSGLATGPGSRTGTGYLPGGQVQVQTNALGLVSRTEYDALNRRVRMTQVGVPQGDGSRVDYVQTWQYDVAGNVVAEVDFRNVRREHRYDALNRRDRTTLAGPHGGPFNADGVLSQITFDRINNVLEEINHQGLTNRYAYDGLHRLAEQTLPLPGAVLRTDRDRLGNVLVSTDPNGKETRFAYDGAQRLRSRVDPEGNETRFDYDPSGNRLRQVDLASGLITTNAYDRVGRPVLAVLNGPGVTNYVTRTRYENRRNEVVVTNARGVVTRSRKDGLDRLAEKVVADGDLNLITRFTYDAAGNLLTLSDAQNGDVDLTHSYDTLGRRLSTRWVSTPDDRGVPVFEEFGYDAGGLVVARRDRRGFAHRATFDNLGRPLKQELRESLSNQGSWLVVAETAYEDAANAQETWDANRNRTRIEFDPLGRVARLVDPLGQVLTSSYDGVNQRERRDRRGQRVVFTYDGLNRLLTQHEFDGTGTLRTSLTNTFQDAFNRRVMTDRRGLQTIVQVDALGRELEVLRSGGDLALRYGSDPVRLQFNAYDESSNLVRSEDADGRVTTHEYDAAERRTRTTEGAGTPVAAATEYTYDAVGNLLTSKDGRSHSGTFDARHEYDARYRLVRTINALNETNRQVFDAANNLVESVDARGGQTRYRYDELNTLLAVDETPRGTGANAGVTRFRYDANRNKLAQQDANGTLVTYEYDGLNRMTRMFQHTVSGQLSEPVLRGASPGGDLTSALETRYGYDPNGNPATLHDPRGQVVESVHDHLNRRISRTYSQHAEQTGGRPLDFQPIRMEWVLDGNGNEVESREVKQLGATTVTERIEQAFDALDRLTQKTRWDHDDATGRRLTFRYDRAGHRTEATDVDGRVTQWVYDARGRVQQVILEPGAGALTAGYFWEPDGLLQRMEYPGGVVAERQYDAADRLISITNAVGSRGPLLSAFTFRYDANGNRREQVEFNPALRPGPETNSYGYDLLNRLTQVTNGSGRLEYTYAPNGNRLTEVGLAGGQLIDRVFLYGALPGVSGTYNGVNSLSRIEDRVTAAQTITYHYDANLNQVSREQGGLVRQFRYDARDQLIATEAGTALTKFDNNSDRLRVKKISAAQETRYLYDESAVVVEYGDAALAHATQRKYEQGEGLVSLGVPGAAGLDRYFYLTDALGSSVHLLSATGVRAADYSYNAWGGLTASAGTLANDRQYTGHYRDAETGLHYLGARYYDDEQARFLAQDPRLGDSGSPNSLHRFLYANANPLRYVDPTGYTSEPAGASGNDPKKEATGTKKGKSNQEVVPERRNTVIDSQTGEHYVPWWSDRQVVAEARKEAKEAAAREIRALEQSLDRADQYYEAYLEWSLAKGQAEAREKMAKVRQLEALVARGGSGDKLQYFTDQWAHMVATAGDDPGLVQAGAAGLIQAIGQYMGGALNVGSGLGTLSGKLDVEETTGVAPSGWDYLAAGADVMQVGGTVGGALANVSRASRVREARTAIQSAFDQEQVARALMAPAGLVDDASRLGAVTELADTWIGRTLRSDEVLTEVVPRVRFDGPILNHLVDAPTQVMSRAELVAASVARDVAKVVDIPETFMGSVRSRLLDIGVGVVSRQEALRLGKPLTWDNPARLIYDKIILVEDALVNAAQRRDLAGAISGNKFGIFEATDVLRANLLHEIGERAIRLFQKGGMSRPVLFNLEVEDVILRRLATEDPEMARRLSQLIGTGAFK